MRHFNSLFGGVVNGFNPRICKRCDRYAIGLKEEAEEVSIHASVKDATKVNNIDTDTALFQSTHL